MGTISAKTLKNAITKARNVGLVEEAFMLEGCELVLRNLRPDEYSALIKDCDGLEDMEYLYQYQKGHLCRAIVELDGVDLRDADYVQLDDDESGKKVKLELHQYLTEHVINSWSKEVLYTAYRKFCDVVEQAERKAKQGITFLLPDETDEERYRRLLTEAKEIEAELPDSLIDSTLEDLGLMRRSTAEEVKRAMERTDQLAREQAAAKVETEAVQPQPQQPVEPPVPAPEPKPTPRPVDPHTALQRAIEARKVPQVAIPQPTPAVPVDPKAAARAARLAAIESGDADPALLAAERLQPDATEVIEIKKQPPFDPRALVGALDQPARGGLNPRFKPGV